MMFIQLLESLHKDDAALMIAVKDKALNKKYKRFNRRCCKRSIWLEFRLQNVLNINIIE